MTPLLQTVFNDDFAHCADSAQFHRRFFQKNLTLADLRPIYELVVASSITLDGRRIPSTLRIKGTQSEAPFAILAQLHGNEPAGLAGIAIAMALSAAGHLKRDVIGIIGNPLAAGQYFEALAREPKARQETRDAFRCGLAPDGTLLPDMNRIPVDFRTREQKDHHTKRAQELHVIGQHISGILDIHSARGNMVCITDHKHDAELKHSPIRAVLTHLAEAISAHASSTVTMQTLKTIFGTLFDLEHQVGIEAGRHEAPESPHNAASFTLSMLHTIDLTDIAPLYDKENGIFTGFEVQPRITYADLAYGDGLRPDDKVYMARSCHALASIPPRCDTVIVKQESGYALQSVADFTAKPAGTMEYAVYQYDEMEAIGKDQVVAVALPSGTAFKTKHAFAGIFISKSAALYDKDPAVGPWPVAADKIGSMKFCYPCQVGELKLKF